MAAPNPACYFCAVWAPARWGSGDGDDPMLVSRPMSGSTVDHPNLPM
jgi:hypothetical protein